MEWVIVRVIVMLMMVKGLVEPVSLLVNNDTSMTIRPDCPYTCDNNSIAIPYPFGIGDSCAYNDSFVIICNGSYTTPKPFLRALGVEVRVILLEAASVLIDNPLLFNDWSTSASRFSNAYDFESLATIQLPWRMNGNCNNNDTNYCGGAEAHTLCNLIGDNQFTCKCADGYQGNPYIGCQDINECEDISRSGLCAKGCENLMGSFRCLHIDEKNNDNNQTHKLIFIGIGSVVGALLFLLGVWWTYKLLKRKKEIYLQKRFFKKNGGLLLQQQLFCGEEGNVEKTKLFSSKELEKATDNYNNTRILGQGGQGTVYKGMLIDGRIVAVKRSNELDEKKIEEFINEVVILSQINHRNVVKLHGCCLETKVPLLVYEFIPNGTLLDYIHDENEDFVLSWDVRLRLAIEVASALAYLHSAASKPIYHRDIKSINILLDDKYRAKVADFGTSRSIDIEQTHCTTRVQGTFGYLDPEYFQSSQFTDKSDVYSFGVVLVELLTGLKAISSGKTDEWRSLATRFIFSMKENQLFDIIDARILNDCIQNEIIMVSNLAKKCLNLNGKKRPTMKEVAMELERIIKLSGEPTFQRNYEEVGYSEDEVVYPWEATSPSIVSLDINQTL